jgi:hypothetical protein
MFHSIHYIHKLLLEPSSVLSVRNKPTIKLFEFFISQLYPHFITSFIVFDFLNAQIGFLYILYVA